MSLPSSAIFLDKNSKIIGSAFCNIGWFEDPSLFYQAYVEAWWDMHDSVKILDDSQDSTDTHLVRTNPDIDLQKIKERIIESVNKIKIEDRSPFFMNIDWNKHWHGVYIYGITIPWQGINDLEKGALTNDQFSFLVETLLKNRDNINKSIAG